MKYPRLLFRPTLIGICILIGATWILFAHLVVPPLIKSAYEGQSFELLNGIISGQDTHPVQHYLTSWDQLSLRFLGALGIWLLFALKITTPSFFQKYVGEATPKSLGAIRIIVCAIALVMVLLEDLTISSRLPAEMARDERMGIVSVLFDLPLGIDSLVTNATGLRTFQIATAVLLLLGTIGWRTRITVPLGAICFLIMGGLLRRYAFFFHTGLLPAWVLIVLAFTPCGHGWSIDALHRSVRRSPAAVYGWSRYACWSVVALAYFAAGLSKLRLGGWDWWSAVNMRSILLHANLQPLNLHFDHVDQLISLPDSFFSVLGAMTLMIELATVTLLFSNIARTWLPLALISMHLGIAYMQNILFLDLLFLPLIFYNVSKWLLAIRLQEFFRGSVADRTGVPQQTAPDTSSRRIRKQQLLYGSGVATLVSVLSASWIFHVEFYPLTSMGMFAGNNLSGALSYLKVVTHDSEGRTKRLFLEDAIGGEADFRYRAHLTWPFHDDPELAYVTQRYLEACAWQVNRKAATDHEIVRIEVQKWEWKFASNPRDPHRGRLVDRFVVDLTKR